MFTVPANYKCKLLLEASVLKKAFNIDLSTDEPPLPSPTMTSTALFSYFQQQFGFTRAQVLYAFIMESLLKSKDLYNCPPCTKGFWSAAFSTIMNICFVFY
jgi:hypothetical protein